MNDTEVPASICLAETIEVTENSVTTVHKVCYLKKKSHL